MVVGVGEVVDSLLVRLGWLLGGRPATRKELVEVVMEKVVLSVQQMMCSASGAKGACGSLWWRR